MQFIKLAKLFFREFSIFMKSGETDRKRFNDLIVKTDELIVKHNELIQHMTQFFITSEKIKISDDIQAKAKQKERERHPNDDRY